MQIGVQEHGLDPVLRADLQTQFHGAHQANAGNIWDSAGLGQTLRLTGTQMALW